MSVSVYSNTIGFLTRQNYADSLSSFSKSLQQLSSGVRVNNTADDAVTVSLSNGLEAQAMALGQASRNAADAFSITQVADDSIVQGLELLGKIKSKALAGVDAVDDTFRHILQNDLTGLLKEFDQVISSSSFNGHNLLTGSFSNKKFQVGSSAGQVLILSLPDMRAGQAGMVNLSQSSPSTVGGQVSLSLYNPYTSESLVINDIMLAYDNTAASGMAALEDAVNTWQDSTGFSAKAVVESISTEAVQGGVASSTFAINGITIGSVNVQANDANKYLVNAINGKSASHGIVASSIDSGLLRLLSSDGRGIEVTGLQAVMSAADASLSTFGYLQIYQPGPYSLSTDSSNVNLTNLTLDQTKFRTMTLADISLNSRVNALDATAVTDAAIADLEKTQAQALAYQAQFKSAVNVLEITGNNLSNSGETMQSVDFENQTSNLAKMQMLMQSGAFAMVQANTWHGFPLDLVKTDLGSSFGRFFSSVMGKVGNIKGDTFMQGLSVGKITPVVRDS